jgi:hypothetical protein
VSRRDRAKGRNRPTLADVRSLVLEAHNHLHQEPPDFDACHDTLHRAMGTGETEIDHTRFNGDNVTAIDADFRAFCQRHGVSAMYIIHQPDGRLLTGGEGRLCAEMDRLYRAGVAATTGGLLRAR